MWIVVKKLDIERGIKMNVEQCVVARAIRRAYRKIGRYPHVEVGASTFSLDKQGEEYRPLPEIAQSLIGAFDTGIEIETPVRFQVTK